MNIRVLLADDHQMFREALRSGLLADPALEIVAEAESGMQALQAVAEYRPDVVVLDIGLQDMSGVEVAQLVTKRFPEVRVMALSGHADRLFVEEMLRAGARGYVTKTASISQLVDAIKAIVAGHSYLSPEVTGILMGNVHNIGGNQPPPATILGKREREVLQLLAEGKRSPEIATALGISSATVDVHRRNIKQKLKLHTTAELTRYAIREGLSST
jgi:DNA-binding NarL/FixJ family response regulator